jgi:beta-lactamase class A
MEYQSALDKINEIMGTIEGKVGVAARLLDGKGEILINATDIYPTASTMKVPVLYELYRQVDEGKIDLNQRVEYNDTHPVCGSGILQDLGFGLSVTVRDLAVLMTVLYYRDYPARDDVQPGRLRYKRHFYYFRKGPGTADKGPFRG